MTYITHHRDSQAAFSIPSILAIVCAIASFFFGAGLGFLLAVAAIVLGIVGFVLALLPGVRGGFASVLSVLAGVIGIVAAIFKLAF
jgi:hypothetical protein